MSAPIWSERMSRAVNRGAGDMIPTWQEGTEQTTPHDYELFAREGYAKNGMIYACVREIATSFSSLTPVMIQPDQQVQKTHRMLDLLGDPNSYQDGREFAEELVTQYETAGNAYVQKVRSASDPQRRRAVGPSPIHELHIIRSDYVTIEPGATRDRDRYLVTVGGQVRQRIPASDMIHIKTPHPNNDFYGLSPIALLVREGTLDLEMADFELAFFRNAGVPFGILNIKGRQNVSPTDREEIKSSFNRVTQGFKNWWSVLVLNREAVEYQALGSPLKELEMQNTRSYTEARICSVFGVPPVIVGARPGFLQGANPEKYEQAQFAFWQETMVPKARRIASALHRGIMTEIGTAADSDLRFGYDFTEVRALQEDRSRKLREVVRMINTGAVTVEQAFILVGMSPPPDSDFYVRTGNQVEVRHDENGNVETITIPQPGGANPDNPLEGAARILESLPQW